MNWITLIGTILIVGCFDFTSSNDSNLNEIAEIEFGKDFIKVTSPTVLNNSTEGRPNFRRKIHLNHDHQNKINKTRTTKIKTTKTTTTEEDDDNNNINNNNDKRIKVRRRKEQKKKFTRLKIRNNYDENNYDNTNNNNNNNDNNDNIDDFVINTTNTNKNKNNYKNKNNKNKNKNKNKFIKNDDSEMLLEVSSSIVEPIELKTIIIKSTTVSTIIPSLLTISNVTEKTIEKKKKKRRRRKFLTIEEKEIHRLARLERKQIELMKIEEEKQMIKDEKRKQRLAVKEEKKRLRDAKRAMKQKRIMERHLKKKLKQDNETDETDSKQFSVDENNNNNVHQELNHHRTHHHHHHEYQHHSHEHHKQEQNNIELISDDGVNLKTTNLNMATHFDDELFEKINFDDIKKVAIGDLSCMKNGFKPSLEIPNANIKYLRNDELGIMNAYLEAEYICNTGFKLKYQTDDKNSSKNLICKNQKWIGEMPKCIPIQEQNIIKDICRYNRGKCDQLCFIDNNKEVCSCYKGFKSVGTKCIDIDECQQNESICEYGCSNTIGSYRCKCPMGLRSGDSNNCVDINECLLRNGHGPCQDTCVNTWSGYKCTCDGLPGSRLSDDKHSCEDFDECSINNGGCSHTCLNTHRRGFCVCPEGWILDEDWKTCIDIDECADQTLLKPELRCDYSCVNTLGSYKCVTDIGADQPIIDELPICSTGYIYNTTSEDCQDLDECVVNNGGCYDRCINTIGSFHCSCKVGYIFGPDKYTCIVSNITTEEIACPPLFPPRHGYLECTRPIARRITNRPGSQCILRCPNGFRVVGKFAKFCGNDGQWNGESDGACIRYPTPKLTCPHDMTIEIPQGEKTVQLFQLPRPKTDVHFDRDVTVDPPEWGKNFKTSSLHVGITNITYTAKHPISKLSVSCTFTIKVLDGKPPVILFCPETQKYSLSKQHDNIKISWIEPDFTDNVNVTDISRTNSPGNYFGVGSHQIVYEARDAAGYTSRCLFKILVSAPKRRGLKLQLPIFNTLYKK